MCCNIGVCFEHVMHYALLPTIREMKPSLLTPRSVRPLYGLDLAVLDFSCNKSSIVDQNI
jgi:hypothetical protein